MLVPCVPVPCLAEELKPFFKRLYEEMSKIRLQVTSVSNQLVDIQRQLMTNQAPAVPARPPAPALPPRVTYPVETVEDLSSLNEALSDDDTKERAVS